MSVAEQIHYYDVEPTVPDKGWIHYISRVPGWEKAEIRVADVVRHVRDVNSNTVGFLPQTMPGDPRNESPRIRLRLAEEAVRVSLFGPTWLERIMTRSLLMGHDAWHSEYKPMYLEQRRQRRKKFKGGRLSFVDPNAEQTD